MCEYDSAASDVYKRQVRADTCNVCIPNICRRLQLGQGDVRPDTLPSSDRCQRIRQRSTPFLCLRLRVGNYTVNEPAYVWYSFQYISIRRIQKPYAARNVTALFDRTGAIADRSFTLRE